MKKKDDGVYERVLLIKGANENYADIREHYKIDSKNRKVTCCRMVVANGKIIDKEVRSVRASKEDTWDPVIGVALASLKCEIAMDGRTKGAFLDGKLTTGSWKKFKDWVQGPEKRGE